MSPADRSSGAASRTDPLAGKAGRVLFLAPTARDAATTQALLAEVGIPSVACPSLERLSEEWKEGAAALLFTEEALTAGAAELLSGALAQQPPWSDLPILILTRGGTSSTASVIGAERLGNVTLLDRPVRKALLVSAIQTALRARLRQYQLREHLAEQERLAQALREADRRKDEFLAMLAHELRNPLAAIVTAATLLRETASSPAVLRQQAVIERQSRLTARLLEDLLDVSRITQGRIELRRQRLDLSELAQLSAANSRPYVERRGHRFTVSLPEEPLFIDADPARIEQIVSNLLTNAAKYTPAGGAISLTVMRDGETGVIRVRDTGVGIPPALLPQVFELFTQGERSLARSEGGVGIGLTMVKRLVELHGGRVEAISDGPDRGSEFIVYLPAASEPAVASGTSREEPTQALPPVAGTRIVLIEDNPDAAATLRELLELWELTVQVAGSGAEGLAAVREHRPSVVLVDIGLPDMDGYEVARRLRAERETAEAPALIALTGYGQEEDRRLARAAGFDRHLTKPIDPDLLCSVLSSVQSVRR